MKVDFLVEALEDEIRQNRKICQVLSLLEESHRDRESWRGDHPLLEETIRLREQLTSHRQKMVAKANDLRERGSAALTDYILPLVCAQFDELIQRLTETLELFPAEPLTTNPEWAALVCKLMDKLGETLNAVGESGEKILASAAEVY